VTVTAQDIKDTFSEFSGTSDQLIERFLTQAERRVNVTQWGEKSDDATLWLTAHLLKIESQLRSGGGAAGGPISQRKVGDLSVSYKIPTNVSDSFLASTTYGQYYLDLKTGIWPERVLGDCCS
jgi:hypothetical protein